MLSSVCARGGALILALAAGTACGTEFSLSEPTGGGAGQGASGGGGVGGGAGGGEAGSSSSGGGGSGGGGARPCEAGLGGQPSLVSTLEDQGAIVNPVVGKGGNSDYDGAFVAGSTDQGLRLEDPGEFVRWAQEAEDYVNGNPLVGTADFCVQPRWDHIDPFERLILSMGNVAASTEPSFVFFKASDGQLVFTARSNGATWSTLVAESQYAMNKDEWYRITLRWDLAALAVQIFLDGHRLDTVASGQLPLGTPSGTGMIWFGDPGEGSGSAAALGGVIDEVWLYTNAVALPFGSD